MFNLIITTIEWIVVLVVSAAFIIGAWRHTVAETLGDPLLVDPSPNAKAKRYLRLAGKVLWHILVPVAMVGGIFLKLILSMDFKDAKSNKDDFLIQDDSIWTRDSTGVWASPSADGDSSAPWSY